MLAVFNGAPVPPGTRKWIVGKAACNRRAAVRCLALPRESGGLARRCFTATQMTDSHRKRRPRVPIQVAAAFPLISCVKQRPNEETFRCLSSSPFSDLHESPGSVRMVDVSTKHHSLRMAAAEAKVFVSTEICNRWKVDSSSASLEQDSSDSDSEPAVGTKSQTLRQRISVSAPRSVGLRSPKGDVFQVAKIAGIMAAKRTSSLIPLCHSLPLLTVEISLTLNETQPATAQGMAATGKEGALEGLADDEDPTKPTSRLRRSRVCTRPYVLIRSLVKAHSATGVEMEALTAVTVAGLTVYDMCKSMDTNITLSDVRLTAKRGGKRDYGPLL